jgi:hypothetical protein
MRVHRLIAFLCLCAVGLLCVTPISLGQAADPLTKLVIGRLDKSIKESSGIVASRKTPGVFWTLDDSGNKPQLFAVTRQGVLLATFPVAAKNVDWEDIAVDDAGHIYIADLGNNAHRRDRGPVVYRVVEPAVVPEGEAVIAKEPLKVDATFRLGYPAAPFDCEALFVWKDRGYVITKMINGRHAELYRFSIAAGAKNPQLFEKIADLPIRAPVTAADISPDGKELAILSVFGPNRFVIEGQPERVADVPYRSVTFLQPDMEAATVVPEGVLATTEGGHVLLFTHAMFEGRESAGPDEPMRIVITRTTRAIKLDGRLDDWDIAASAQLLKSVPTEATPPAKLWTTWTPEGLYIAAHVPEADPGPLVDQWFNGDVVEIFLGRHASDRLADYADGDQRCYIGFAKNPDSSRGEVVLKWPRREAAPETGKVAGMLDAEGYTVEAFLPAASFGTGQPLESGGMIRFNVSILAREPRRNWYVSTSNTDGTWMSPLKWSIATLTEEK